MRNFKREKDDLFICVLRRLNGSLGRGDDREDNLGLSSAEWPRTKPISNVFPID